MRIPAITETLSEPYEVLDSILAYQLWEPDSYDRDNAYSSVKNKLRLECKAIGGNAVINCQFAYKQVYEFGFGGIGERQLACLLAFGTAVLSSFDYNNRIVNYNENIVSLRLDLSNHVLCPVCGDKLQLDSAEINLQYFECQHCNNEILFKMDAT